MRQVGLLNSAQEANRFTAYLIVERISAMVDQEGEKFAVWIREENDFARAKNEFSAYVANPGDARYQGKEREAEALLRTEQELRRRGQKNIVQVKQRAAPSVFAGRTPLCLTLMAISISFTLFFYVEGGRSRAAKSPIQYFFFTDAAGLSAWISDGSSDDQKLKAVFAPIARGQIWRLITPIFIHLSITHILFNMWALLSLGSRVESRFGAVQLGIWVLALAIFSNVAQVLFESPAFGGISGVVYGIFGIAWAYSKSSGESSTLVTREESFFYLLWLVVCVVMSSDQWAEAMGEERRMLVANVAHAAGFFFGVAIGFVLGWRQRQATGK
jgi:GlpG protein